MAVVINDFEIVPEQDRGEESRAATPAAPPPSPARIAREVEGALRDLLARRARLRAT